MTEASMSNGLFLGPFSSSSATALAASLSPARGELIHFASFASVTRLRFHGNSKYCRESVA